MFFVASSSQQEEKRYIRIHSSPVFLEKELILKLPFKFYPCKIMKKMCQRNIFIFAVWDTARNKFKKWA